MLTRSIIGGLIGLALVAPAAALPPAIPGYPVEAVHESSVQLHDDNFWASRLETNSRVTAWHNLKMCEDTGRLDNFRKAAGLMDGYYRGLRFDDSDVYKAVEGAARALAAHEDPELDAYLDELIALFAAAQEDSGYIYTSMQVPHNPDRPVKGLVFGERWIHEQESHETYCMGHLIEAGVEHYRVTGKRSLLEIGIRAADHIDEVFGPGKLELPPGHQQIEIALAKLSVVTGEERYLELANFFLEQRGRLSDDRQRLWGSYLQDDKPVREQTEAVGHAVRAAYQYMAMADVAVLNDDEELRDVVLGMWDNVVNKKLYLTGGIGGGLGEGFSSEYDLPNFRAYNETCSSIANILWQQRLFQLEGDAKYIDVLERCLYNSFLSGVSLEGDTFFYPNKLNSPSGQQRSPWFGCACCPPNVLRFIPQVPGLFYATAGDTAYVNLFGGNDAALTLDSGDIKLAQQSNYPWSGEVEITVEPGDVQSFTLAVRVPGWLKQPLPSALYSYTDDAVYEAVIKVNGEVIEPPMDKGYAMIERAWSAGDVVTLSMPLPVRQVVAVDKVAATRGHSALARGPLIYTVEGVDNEGNAHNLVISTDSEFVADKQPDKLGGLVTITGPARRTVWEGVGQMAVADHTLKAIPYYAWAHRGASPQRVWLANTEPLSWPTPTRAAYSQATISYSGKNPWSRAEGMNDQILPASSSDNEVPRFLWDQTDTAPMGAGALETDGGPGQVARGVRWVQYDFGREIEISSSSVYWADGGRGWSAPNGFRLLAKVDGEWKPITDAALEAETDTLQAVTFDPVKTDAVRLEVTPARGRTAGILEWVVQ